MVNLFGYVIYLRQSFDRLDSTLPTFLITVVAWVVICLLAYLVVTYFLKAAAHRLPGDVEDTLLGILRKPFIFSDRHLRAGELVGDAASPIRRSGFP